MITNLLCLSNGERIPVPPSVRLVFEVADLSNASPATISRLGMVFMGTTLGHKPLIKVGSLFHTNDNPKKNICINSTLCSLG